LVVLDEAVSALDVSVQTQVMNLLLDLQENFGLSYLFISHSMSSVKYLADRVMVMYLGRVVESAPAEEFFKSPAHPYSKALLSAVPVPRVGVKREQIALSGDVPSPFNVPSGCVFRTRCPIAQDICISEIPLIQSIGKGRTVACHFPQI
jgi:oligopeptide/dipeptide ABC transporter ATP-binding protein